MLNELDLKESALVSKVFFYSLKDLTNVPGGGGGEPSARPPNGHGPMIFMPKMLNFLNFFSARKIFMHNFNRNMAKTR